MKCKTTSHISFSCMWCPEYANYDDDSGYDWSQRKGSGWRDGENQILEEKFSFTYECYMKTEESLS